MAQIVDYASLCQSVVDFSHRSDITSYVDYFIQRAQEKIARDIFEANFGNGIRLMETSFGPTAIDPVAGTISVPSGYIAPKYATVSDGNSDTWPLIFKAVAWIYDAFPSRVAAGIPAFIARDGSAFIFGPFPDSAYEVQGVYYAQIPALSASDTTNWLVTSAPTLLHSACMRECGAFIKDVQMAQAWDGDYQPALKMLVQQDQAERFAASTMQIDSG